MITVAKQGGAMKLVKIFLVVLVTGMILACTSAQDKASKSEEAVNKERLVLVDKYQKCMKKAGGTRTKRLRASNI